MANNKADLDAAIAQVRQDTADAAQRAGKALGDLLDKVNAGEDFSAEVDQLKAAHNELISIAGDAAGTNASSAPATPAVLPDPATAPAADATAAGAGDGSAADTAATTGAAANPS